MSNNDCPEKKPLTDEYLKKMDAYWRAANYLAAAQLYMLKNPLLREPLTRDQVKKKIQWTFEHLQFYRNSHLLSSYIFKGNCNIIQDFPHLHKYYP